MVEEGDLASSSELQELRDLEERISHQYSPGIDDVTERGC